MTWRMPGAARSWSSTSAGTGSLGAINITAVSELGDPAHVHVRDVHAGVAEQRADGADHTRTVVVLDDDHVVDRRDVERGVVDVDDALLALRARQGAADRMPATAQGQQVDEVGRRGGAHVAHLDTVLLRELRRIHVGDRLVGDRSEEPLQHGEFDDPGVVPGDLTLGADLEFGRERTDQRDEQPTEALGQRQVRAGWSRSLPRH